MPDGYRHNLADLVKFAVLERQRPIVAGRARRDLNSILLRY
jgi:hypothetical protein